MTGPKCKHKIPKYLCDECSPDPENQLRCQLEEATSHVVDLVAQSCWYSELDRVEGELDSLAISTYAHALRWLAEQGYFKIKHQVGRRVIGTLDTEKCRELEQRIMERAMPKDPPSCA